MIHVLFIDDHEMLRDGFCRLVENQKDMHLVASTGSVPELFDCLKKKQVDVIVLDISLEEKNGIEVLKDIKVQYPNTIVLILSMHAEEHYAIRALQNGAAGYMTKGSNSRTLFEAIRNVYKGKRYISPHLAELLAQKTGAHRNGEAHSALSDREFEVLLLIGKGRSTGEIAGRLSISENTVRTYRRRVLEKLDLCSTADLIKYSLEHQLLE